LSNTFIAYVIYVLLVYIGTHYIVANIVAFLLSVLNSFFWNHKYVFKDETGGKRNLLHTLIKTYVSYAFSGLIVGNILLYIYIDMLFLSKYVAPILVLLVTVPLNFFLNKLWTFKSLSYCKEEIK